MPSNIEVHELKGVAISWHVLHMLSQCSPLPGRYTVGASKMKRYVEAAGQSGRTEYGFSS